jgi:hypothetical protein
MAGLPLLVALIPFSVVGVMLWRYSTQMGGGLVAKAWRCILLYGVLWLTRMTFAGVLNSAGGATTGRPLGGWLTATIWLLLLLASEYMIFLGASYQYEVSTSAVETDHSAVSNMPVGA